MVSRRKAAGATAVALAVIVVVIVAAVGTYFAFSGNLLPKPNSTSSQTGSNTTYHTTTGAKNSGSYYYYFNPTAKRFFQNYSQTTYLVTGNSSLPSYYNLTVSYRVLESVINTSTGDQLTLVNFTQNGVAAGLHIQSSSVVYFNSTMYPTIVTVGGVNKSGTAAAQAAFDTTQYYYLVFVLHNFCLSATGAPLQQGLTSHSPTNETFGNTQLTVTKFTDSSYTTGSSCFTGSCSSNPTIFGSMSFSIGEYPTNAPIMTGFSATDESFSGHSWGAISCQLISVSLTK